MNHPRLSRVSAQRKKKVSKNASGGTHEQEGEALSRGEVVQSKEEPEPKKKRFLGNVEENRFRKKESSSPRQPAKPASKRTRWEYTGKNKIWKRNQKEDFEITNRKFATTAKRGGKKKLSLGAG